MARCWKWAQQQSVHRHGDYVLWIIQERGENELICIIVDKYFAISHIDGVAVGGWRGEGVHNEMQECDIQQSTVFTLYVLMGYILYWVIFTS